MLQKRKKEKQRKLFLIIHVLKSSKRLEFQRQKKKFWKAWYLENKFCPPWVVFLIYLLMFQDGSGPSTDGSRYDLTRAIKSADSATKPATTTSKTAIRAPKPVGGAAKTATLAQVHRPASSSSSGSSIHPANTTSPQPLIYSSMKYSFLGTGGAELNAS